MKQLFLIFSFFLFLAPKVMSAENIPWQEISRRTENVKIELGFIDGPNVWCNLDVLPTMQWMKTTLRSDHSSNCKNMSQEMLRLSRLQGGLYGSAEIIEFMRIVPGRDCSPLEDCNSIPPKKYYRKTIFLNLENVWFFTGQSDET